MKIAEGLLSKIPEDSSFHTELAMKWRAMADSGGIQRGRVLFAQIMYRYELAEEGRGMTSLEELMKLTCHNDDIVKFRHDFKTLWGNLDPQLKASIGKVAIREFIYKQFKNSKKLEKQMKDYEQVNKYDTPRKYARIRQLPWLWRQITE